MKQQERTLRRYCEWMLGEDDGRSRLPDCSEGAPVFQWYGVAYPLRALIGAARLLGEESYARKALAYMDVFVGEQLPQGGFTADFRGTPTSKLSREAHREILRSGKVNLADNGSNVACLVQAACVADPERRQRYLEAARRWFEDWVPIWALTEAPSGGSAFWSGKFVMPRTDEPPLREGIYGNGIWEGQKINTPYTMAICNIATAFAIYAKATGDAEYAHNAEACARFLCKQWLEDGRPLNLSVYPLPRVEVVADLSRSFYLMEGLCWAHSVAQDAEVKTLIEKRLKEWLFAPAGLLSQWKGSWFDFNATASAPLPFEETDEIRSSKLGLRFFWEMAKATGIPYLFSYLLQRIEERPEIREKLESGLRFLRDPGRARMTGVMSDPLETYGGHAVQATGFAGLSILEGISPGAAFECDLQSHGSPSVVIQKPCG